MQRNKVLGYEQPRGPLNPFTQKIMHDDGRTYGKYKHKPNFRISPDDLARALNGQKTSYGHTPVFIKTFRDKAYVAFVYWTGTRKLEPSKIMKEDMKITKEFIIVNVPAFKYGERAGALTIPISNEGMEYVIMRYNKTRPGKQVFQVSKAGSYRIIKRALGVCPHWLRYNFITMVQQYLPGQPADVDTKIMAWTGIRRRETLDKYRLKSERDISDVADALRGKGKS